MLRKRKAPVKEEPLLPLHDGASSSRNGTGSKISKGRRKKKASRWFSRRWFNSVALCCVCLGLTLGGILVAGPFLFPVWEPKHPLHKKVVEHAREIYARHGWHRGHHHHQTSKDSKKIAYEPFQCPNGSHGYLNDDYCDCLDGSDEPRTSACSHLLVRQPVFHCDTRGAALGSVGASEGTLEVIYASRVGDGVKDCANGSDETKEALHLVATKQSA